LFGSRFDEAYANSMRQLGIRHHENPLDMMWYALGYVGVAQPVFKQNNNLDCNQASGIT